MRIQDSTGSARLCKAIHGGTEDQIRKDPEKTIVYLRGSAFCHEAKDEKLDKTKVAEARRVEMRNFENHGRVQESTVYARDRNNGSYQAMYAATPRAKHWSC